MRVKLSISTVDPEEGAGDGAAETPLNIHTERQVIT